MKPRIQQWLILQELLQYEGYSTKTADSGITALSVIGEFKPHVVLLDIHMPDMDGFQCLQQINILCFP